MKKWLEKVSNSTLLSDGLNITELFHPEIFMNACRQRFSRKLKIPIDELQMISTFNEAQVEGVDVIKLKGLLIQGCVVNRNYMLQEGPKNLPEFVELPPLFISFVSTQNYSEASKTAEFPVFTSESREKMLFSVRLPY